MNNSLKIRLVLLLLIPIVIGILAIGVASYINAYHEAEEIYDAKLAHMAKVLRALIQHEVEEFNDKPVDLLIDQSWSSYEYEKKLAYRAWYNGKILLHSETAENFGNQIQKAGFTDQVINGVPWHFFTLYDKEYDVIIEVAEKKEIRIELIDYILKALFTPLLLILPLVAVIIWRGVERGLLPLHALSLALKQRDEDDLTSIDSSNVPIEILPLIQEINELMLRLECTLVRERSFTDNAAHELRTPLAALKTQAQVALRIGDEQDRKKILTELISGADRATHLVEQLLTFSRLQNHNVSFEKINLSESIQKISRELAPSALKKHIELIVDTPSNAFILGNQQIISIIFTNLLDNAIKYTSGDGRITVNVIQENNTLVVKIIDTGSGILQSDEERIFERFYRGKGTKNIGCGLGLAMVKWGADLHNAKVSVKNTEDTTGTIAMICFAV